MLLNYLKIAFRGFKRDGSYSLINVLGLSLGLTTSIFIFLWVIDEVQYDAFNKHGDRVYQIMGNHKYPEAIFTMSDTPGPLVDELRGLPEVENASRLTFFGGKVLFRKDTELIYENGAYAEDDLFEIFTINVLEGNPNKPLVNNNSIALSKKLAKKYFNDGSAIGGTLHLNANLDVTVTAVFDDLQENSTLHFDFILPYEIYAKTQEYDKEWGAWTGGKAFVKVHEGVNIDSLNSKMSRLITQPLIWPRWDSNVELFLFALKDWRLRANFENGVSTGGRILYVNAFSMVALFLMLIGSINFMNMATSKAAKRSKEIGLRKTVGASRFSLVKQFMGESILYALISLVVALIMVHLFLGYFNTIISKNLTVDYTNPYIILTLIGTTTLTALLSGSYPAFYLASLRPTSALKSHSNSVLSGATLRKSLVVVQFVISVLLVLGSMVVYKQIDFIRNKNLGFDKENIFYFDRKDGLQQNFESFRREVLENPAIEGVGLANANPMEIFGQIDGADDAWPGKTKNDGVIFKYLKCDANFLSTLNFTVVEGRGFSDNIISDSVNYIVNEEAVLQMKLKNPIGQEIKFERKGKIVGVLKDFHSTGLQKPIEPVLIAMRPDEAQTVFVKYEPGQIETALDHTKSKYKKYEMNFPFEVKFIDDPYGRQYQLKYWLESCRFYS